jgi:hypothetical protein
VSQMRFLAILLFFLFFPMVEGSSIGVSPDIIRIKQDGATLFILNPEFNRFEFVIEFDEKVISIEKKTGIVEPFSTAIIKLERVSGVPASSKITVIRKGSGLSPSVSVPVELLPIPSVGAQSVRKAYIPIPGDLQKIGKSKVGLLIIIGEIILGISIWKLRKK